LTSNTINFFKQYCYIQLEKLYFIQGVSFIAVLKTTSAMGCSSRTRIATWYSCHVKNEDQR